MSLSVRETLKIYPLSKGKVVAGAEGLDHRISAVTVLEIPDAPEFLEENLLALTSFYAIAENFEEQKKVIKLLASKNVSALIVFNVGRENGLTEISSELIDLCNKLNFPLITMPLEISYYDVLEVVINELSNKQVDKLKMSIQIYQAFTNQLLTSDKSYTSLLQTLNNLLQTEILFFNHNNVLIYPTPNMFHKGSQKLQQYIQSVKQYLPKNIPDTKSEFTTNIQGINYLIYPVATNDLYYGSLVVTDVDEQLTDIMRLAILQTTEALSVSLLSNVRMEDYQKRMQNIFLKDLLTNTFSDLENLLIQAKQLSLEFIECLNELIVIKPFKIDSNSNFFYHFDNKRQDYYHILESIFESETLVKFNMNQQVVLYDNKMESRGSIAKKLVKLRAEANAIDIPLTICHGNTYLNLSEIHSTYSKASAGIRIIENIYEKPTTKIFNDIEIFHIVLSQIDPITAQTIVNNVFGPIKGYDSQHEAHLEETLDCLIQSNFTTSEVADKLFIHRNTVLQRKNRIEELLQEDSFSSVGQLKLSFAFIVKKLFQL